MMAPDGKDPPQANDSSTVRPMRIFEQSKTWYRPVPLEEEEETLAYRHIFFIHPS